MQVGVDETGSFRGSNNSQFGLVTLVTVTDLEWQNFQNFVNSDFPTAFEKVKGSNIIPSDRERIIKYVSRRPEIRYTTLVFDLDFGTDETIGSHRTRQITKIQDWMDKNRTTSKASLISDLELLRNQIGNLSYSDYTKFFFITLIFMHWQRFFQFDYVYTHTSRDQWLMHHVVDMQNKPEKFKRIVKTTLALTANHLNPSYGINTPREWNPSHPFIKNHSFNGQIGLQDGKKFFEDFKIGNEQQDHILFLPDLIGSIIYNSILRSSDVRWLKLLSRLKQNRSIAMTNHGKANYYYQIAGLSGVNNQLQTDPMFQNHFDKMKAF